MSKTVADNEGKEYPEGEWIEDESTGERTMYTRLQSIPICKQHTFNKQNECGKCPYVFVGFRSHVHIHKADGIYRRDTGVKVA